MNARAAMQSYGQVQVNAGVEDASSHRLIGMLYEGLLTRIAQAKGALLQKDIETKGKKVSEAMNILMGLREFLDVNTGGELAQNLDSLYDYIQRSLMQAHMKNDESKFDECRDLLLPITGAWAEIS
ncbi:flagellar export chaperone FliS [Pseudomaricurvus albidus]|uniref:flagellar export chaperone FliS n=1 Tax=Pseudomaricurvus albidus TaxID=2842452 RepID=UPI0034E24C55